ncbi:Severe Depolymerization of Actin [Xylographa soralifera]|nr:Severe Depolymerization of Actin [Xylographa soralifera]
MVKRKVGALEKVDADLANLQNKIRRDPVSYKEEFIKQFSQYESHREIFLQAPSSATDAGIVSLRDLIDFTSHVAECFPELTAKFPNELIEILSLHHQVLESELREKIVGSLVLLRRKDIIDSSILLHALFPILTSTPSKPLRTLLFQKILSDLRTSNSKTTNHRLNRTIQTVLYNLLTSDRTSSKGIWAVKITRELWKRQIWTDSKAVEIMKEACLADNEKVIVGGVRFFLGGDKEREELDDESSDEDAIDLGKLKHQMGINKKSKRKAKVMENAVSMVKRKERKKKQPHPLNFSAFHLLHDPQGFAETLFSKHLQNTKSKLNLDQKLQVLQLVSRLVGLHKLTIMSLYSYFIKYLTPRQPSVTSFLASLAQATHSLVPPDVLEPLVQKIANEFVSEASASEVASAGLNAIREICVRQPLVMNDTLLQDLVMYRKSKDKGVVMAAKGLLGLYREVGAEMLKKRDRGKEAAMGLRAGDRKERRFGEEEAGEIEGLELLEKWKEEEKERKRLDGTLLDKEADVADDEDENGWEVAEDDSDDSGGWINVESDVEIEISDSDDDKPVPKRTKLDPMAASQDDNKENAISAANELEKRTSTLATTRILTPADLAKLHELRLEASVNKALPVSQRKRLAQQQQAQQNRHADDPLTAAEIEGLAALSKKASKAEKVALAKEGKGERTEHKSTQALRREKKESEGKSTTNREKARKKNFMMTLGKAKGKQKKSLVERGRVLKAHVERAKRGGKRGNKGK